MIPRKNAPGDRLRRQPKKVPFKESKTILKVDDKDIKRLIHELQVHQIELEMQNEELRRAQIEIEESRSKYVDLFDFAPVGYFTLNRTGKVVEVNLTGARLLGLGRTQVVGRIFSAFVAPGFRPAFREHCRKVAKQKEGEKGRCELKLIKKDGISFYASLESTLASDPGKNFRIRSAVMDIRDRKQAEEEIRKLNQELEQRVIKRTSQLEATNKELQNEIAQRKRAEETVAHLASFPELNPNPIIEVDLTGHVHYLNPAAKELFPGIETAGPQHPWVKDLESLSAIFKHRNPGTRVREVRIGGAWYEQTIFFDSESKRLRIYGCNIADRKGMVEELRRSRQELELRINERTAELAKAIEELTAEIAVRKQTEETLRKLTHDLNKRIQEINCLYATCYQVEKQSTELEEKLRGVVNLLPSGWQYPEITSARIILDQKEYKTDNFRETPWKQDSEFHIDGQRIGRVEVCYLEEKPKADEGPFLKEERILINTIAMELGEMIGHSWADQALRDVSLYARSLIEASLDPLLTISRDGKITDVNKATELITGFSREALIGSDFSDYFTEPERARKGYQQVFYNGFVRDYPLAIRHASGRVTDVLYNAALYRNEAGEIQGVFAAARDVTDRKLAEEKLRESENRLRLLSSELLTIQENERRRIALEIHDSLGQALSAIKFKVSNAIQEMLERKANIGIKPLEELIPVIQEGIDEARRIQMDLRPSILDDLGILVTISWFCRQFQKTYGNIRIETQIDIDEDVVPKPLRVVIYRILQEAMNNIAKHSHASFVSLSLKKEDGRVALTIQDNGRGFDVSKAIERHSAGDLKGGLGLTGMRERAELSRGSFAIESAKDKGTTIQVSWPP